MGWAAGEWVGLVLDERMRPVLWLAASILVVAVLWRVCVGRLPGWYRCGLPGCGRWFRIWFWEGGRRRYCWRHGYFEREDAREWKEGDRGVGSFGVYVLEMDGKRNRFYVGQTRDLSRRLREHAAGMNKTTAGRAFRLVYSERVGSRKAAVRREQRLKIMSVVRPRKLRRMAAVQAAAMREIEKGFGG